jgi:hypothetical protein
MLPLVLLAIGLFGFAWMAPRIPHDQSVDIALGDHAASVRDLTVRYAQDGETQRQVTFHWKEGAPKLVHHEPHLPDGDYVALIETDGQDGMRRIERNVTLQEGTTTQIHAEVP